MSHSHALPISHACIQDCARCKGVELKETVLFAEYIRESIEFPDAPIDCKQTKVDLSCFFGGEAFGGGNQAKERPTLVRKPAGAPLSTEPVR